MSDDPKDPKDDDQQDESTATHSDGHEPEREDPSDEHHDEFLDDDDEETQEYGDLEDEGPEPSKKGLGTFFKKVKDVLPAVISPKKKQREEESEQELDATMPSFQISDAIDEAGEEEEIEETLRSIDLEEQELGPEDEETVPNYDVGVENDDTVEIPPKENPRFNLSFFKKKQSSDHGGQQEAPKSKRRRAVNVAGFYYRLFAPQTRPLIHRTFVLLLFIGGAIFSARFLATFLNQSLEQMMGAHQKKKKGQIVPTRPGQNLQGLGQDIAALTSNDLFQAKRAQVASNPKKKEKPVVDQNLICREARRRTSESLKLKQTIVLQDIVKSIASVQIRGKGQYLRVGDRIPGMAEVGLIAKDKLIFKNLKTGLCEYIDKPAKDGKAPRVIPVEKNLAKAKKLLSDAAQTGIATDGTNFKIKKSFRDQAMGNMSELITQARAVQIKNPDGTLSFRMQEIVPDSLYTKLGIENGDVIDSINGKKFTNLNEIMSLFGTLKDNDQFEISLRRNGTEINREYNFVN